MSNQLATALRELLECRRYGAVSEDADAWLDAKQALAAHEAAKERTGWPADGRMAQDDSRELSKWLSNTPGARRLVDEAAKPAAEVDHHEFSAARQQWRATLWTDEALPTGTKLYAAPVAVASPWLPIETAPKDGEVLIYVTETDEQFVAYWDEGWRFSRNAKLKSPTHWMPLPPAPKEQA